MKNIINHLTANLDGLDPDDISEESIREFVQAWATDATPDTVRLGDQIGKVGNTVSRRFAYLGVGVGVAIIIALVAMWMPRLSPLEERMDEAEANIKANENNTAEVKSALTAVEDDSMKTLRTEFNHNLQNEIINRRNADHKARSKRAAMQTRAKRDRARITAAENSIHTVEGNVKNLVSADAHLLNIITWMYMGATGVSDSTAEAQIIAVMSAGADSAGQVVREQFVAALVATRQTNVPSNDVDRLDRRINRLENEVEAVAHDAAEATDPDNSKKVRKAASVRLARR